MKSGKLNFLGPSGPLQACNGTDLPPTIPSMAIIHTNLLICGLCVAISVIGTVEQRVYMILTFRRKETMKYITGKYEFTEQ